MRLLIALMCLWVTARAQIDGPHGHVWEHLFHEVDQNGDGTITKAEFDAISSYLDIDGNGQVTEPEFIQAWQSVTQGAGDPDINRHAAELLFRSVDGGSGAVSMANVDVFFTAFDADGNGSVPKDEFLQEWHKIHPAHGLIGPPGV